MKKSIIHTKVQNFSRFPIDIVWENAKDLEHVAYLHGKTNKTFKLMHVEVDKNSPHEYDVMIFRTERRLKFLSFSTFGFRKIISEYNLYQIEYIPIIGMTIALNSILKPSNDPEFPTAMVDEVVMEVPSILSVFKGYFIRALQRHTKIQCSEDESFRARRHLLKERRISFPLTLFNLSHWSELTALFTESPSQSRAS